jgi:putative membrane protein
VRLRSLQGFAVVAGLGFVVWLVWEIGPTLLWAHVSALSWRLGLLMLPQALVSLLDGVGWRYAFPDRLPGVAAATTIRLAGEAVNDTTPTGQLGGDALKAWLVTRAHVPLTEGLVAAVVGKTALVASQVAFLALGLAVAWHDHRVSSSLRLGLSVLVGAGLLATAGFLGAQGAGLFRAGSRLLGWIGLGGRLSAAALRLDTDLRGYYRHRRARLAVALLLHFLGWLAGALDVWLALWFLGAPVSPATALVIESLATGVRSAGFLVPGALGIQEGALVGILSTFGLAPSLGLAFGLVRRIRDVLWDLIGYGCLAAWGGVASRTVPSDA